MKKHANLFCVGAALSLLCACEPVVKGLSRNLVGIRI